MKRMGSDGIGPVRRVDEPMKTFRIETALAAPADAVWASAATMEGVNAELGPWFRMTAPAAAAGLDLSRAPTGRRLFRSWLLLLGVLPVDWDDLTLAAVSERSFAERSTMLSMRRWEHDRAIEPVPGGCLVRDELRFAGRVPATEPLLARIVALTFRHRHAQLRRRWGALAAHPMSGGASGPTGG